MIDEIASLDLAPVTLIKDHQYSLEEINGWKVFIHDEID
jgi:hypothetical protein